QTETITATESNGQQTTAVTFQNTVSLTINPIDSNGLINGRNAANGIIVSGTARDGVMANLVGQTVTLTLNGQNYTGTVQSDGTWSVTVGASALSALTDGQAYQVSASVTDKAGNLGATTTTAEVFTI